MLATKSLNCYSHHAPKMEWFVQYFTLKNDFDEKHTLGSQMYSFFRRFLRDAELLDNSGFSKTAQVIDKLGLDNDASWGIMMANLAYTPQINWVVKRMGINETYERDFTLSLLVADGAKESWVKEVWSSFSRIADLPFSRVGFGQPYKENGKLISLTRLPWANPNPLVILYSLYKFAENCGGYWQFTLARLLNFEVESNGVSPAQIFGLDGDAMQKLLMALSINHPEFITAQFTLDLDAITLYDNKMSSDVLALF